MKRNLLRVYLISIASILVLTMVFIKVIMDPPSGDLVGLLYLLVTTGLLSGVIGYLSLRLGWWRRLRSLRLSLTLGYLLASGLTLLNVWVTARLMFINQHDFLLASLLLLFASGISTAFGIFLSNSITMSLNNLVKGAEELGKSDFSIRVPIEGNDEIAELAASFNGMAERLEQAKEAERNLDEVRRDLVAWVSHDLRTPLASLQAMLAALVDGVVDDPETTTRYLLQSQGEISRMSALIDDLFELAQLDAGYLDLHGEHSSIADLISDTLEAHTARAKEHEVGLRGDVSADVDLVWMAADKIGRVLHNLVENAIRHTPPGGQVDVQATIQNEKVIISIRDSGEGISTDDLPHVFERFYRGEKSRTREGYEKGGSGLGLAIAKGVIEAHHGRIWIESEQKQGTIIQFSLPLTNPAEK